MASNRKQPKAQNKLQVCLVCGKPYGRVHESPMIESIIRACSTDPEGWYRQCPTCRIGSLAAAGIDSCTFLVRDDETWTNALNIDTRLEDQVIIDDMQPAQLVDHLRRITMDLPETNDLYPEDIALLGRIVRVASTLVKRTKERELETSPPYLENTLH